jgi:hypothetical protein
VRDGVHGHDPHVKRGTLMQRGECAGDFLQGCCGSRQMTVR